LIERGAVIGAALDAWMLTPGWVRGQTTREIVGLEAVADHIDHVCQLAGNALHAAIGSDLDGGFGTEQTPTGLDRISELEKLAGILGGRGYSPEAIEGILHGNWLRFFGRYLPR
jgi:membrane dipeptidase